MIEMVEVHDDKDCVWITSLDQVIFSIRQVPGIDETIESLKAEQANELPQYPQLFGRVFSVAPSALSYVLRKSCPELSGDKQPIVVKIALQKESRTLEILDLLQRLCDLSQTVFGSISCLSSRVDPKLHFIPTVLQVFLGEHQFISFYQDPHTIAILKTFASASFGPLKLEIYGNLGNYGSQVSEGLRAFIAVEQIE
eukprot:TRINITY_DN13070_c1_g2_i2.p2 TRINITY_DN13070_c1_g2~~TRINITY_DN13070_c1_g2_i2.p2  ORF type:complete len:197 (-),score=15.81 TRINITY_DN13070_c1_g2_i2:289-879(-)